MVENIPLTVYAYHGTVVVSSGVINAVVNDISTIGKGSRGAVRGGICKAAATLGGIYHIINAVYFSGRAGFKEKLFLFVKAALRGFPAGDKMLDAAAVDHLVHIVAVHFRKE